MARILTEEQKAAKVIKQKKYYEENKEAKLAYDKKWREENKEAKAESRLRRKFGIGLNEYEEMIVKQEGNCLICKEVCSTGRRLAVDHCHVTGKVRGLLCSKCNIAIGLLKDDVSLLATAIDYLNSHR